MQSLEEVDQGTINVFNRSLAASAFVAMVPQRPTLYAAASCARLGFFNTALTFLVATLVMYYFQSGRSRAAAAMGLNIEYLRVCIQYRA